MGAEDDGGDDLTRALSTRSRTSSDMRLKQTRRGKVPAYNPDDDEDEDSEDEPTETTAQSAKPAVRLVVFDFDQTLSTIHVFKVLAGWEKLEHDPLPKTVAATQRGQIHRINALNQAQPYDSYGPVGFVTKAFGGDERVEQLRAHLKVLRSSGAHAVVCTRGLTGAVKKCLNDVDLLQYLDDVYGNSDECYASGKTAFDKYVHGAPPTPEDEQMCVFNDGYSSKNEVIERVVEKLGISNSEAILVDDDPSEIGRAKTLYRTLLVENRCGITRNHMDILEEYVRGSQPAEPESAVPSFRPPPRT